MTYIFKEESENCENILIKKQNTISSALLNSMFYFSHKVPVLTGADYILKYHCCSLFLFLLLFFLWVFFQRKYGLTVHVSLLSSRGSIKSYFLQKLKNFEPEFL